MACLSELDLGSDVAENSERDLETDLASETEADSAADSAADSGTDYCSADSAANRAAHPTGKKYLPKHCWNCALHHFENLTNVAQIQGDQVRQDLDFVAKKLNLPAETNAESHD